MQQEEHHDELPAKVEGSPLRQQPGKQPVHEDAVNKILHSPQPKAPPFINYYKESRLYSVQ